ncbi:hypothetical protein [Salinimonas lutimaris]|uniref:hypothetical protein n=1 Tax=Salinimonas lutimaris TaxID=914153 RepID=UPI0010C1344F|nr:hypothetical protein [Salinimonas lutimaris]
MARMFAVLVQVAVLILILRMPMMQAMLQDIQATVSDWLLELDKLPEQQALDDLKVTTGPLHVSMRPFQQRYLNELLQSKDNVIQFYAYYCQGADMNPYIYGSSRTYLCDEISKTPLLTKS